MSQGTRDGRYMPVLAVLVIIILGLSAWSLYRLSFGPAGSAAAIESLINAQAANLQARNALAGDLQGYEALRNTASMLNVIRTATLTEKQRAALGELRINVDAVLEGQGDVEASIAAINRTTELVPRFAEAVAAVQAEPAIQQQPPAVAQLERLRLLAETLQTLVRNLPEARDDTTRRLLEADSELQQIVRALQAGDPQLGIAAVTGVRIEPGIASVARRAEQLSAATQDAVRRANQTEPARDAADRLDQLVLAMETDRIAFGDPAVRSGLSRDFQFLLGLLGIAAVLVLVMALLWIRGSGQRARTARLAAQNERDQQAILKLLDELSNLADGDLTVQATVSEDITGAIADSVNFAVEALRDLVVTISDGAILLEDATKQTEASARALSAASEAQSRQIKHASHSIQQMAASIDEVSGNAERSADVARHSVDIAHKGGDAVRRTIEGMNTIRETIQETSKRIKRLGESSQEIGDIVELINDIADQTNILALNASIQASMAGEAGRGFAVVADEVQRLAERSTNATKQIEVLVSTIQADTNEAVVSMERSTTDVVGGALLAENAGAALEEIEQVSNQIAMLVQNISGSAREQSEASRKVLAIAEKLKSISRETDTSAATTTGFVSKLATLATQLRESVAGFTLPESARQSRLPEPEITPAVGNTPTQAAGAPGSETRRAAAYYADERIA